MDEFLKLILTGGRLQSYKKFNRLCGIAAAAQLVFALPLIFLTANVHAAVPATLGVLIIVAGIATAVLSVKRKPYFNALAAEQIAAENADGELSSARKRLAEKFLTLYGKPQNAVVAVLAVIPTAISAVAAVLSLFATRGNEGFALAVPALVAASVIFAVLPAFVPAANDFKRRAELYEQADEEITVLKKGAGFSQGLISKQSYAARNTATRSQELFLRDPADRAELKRIASASGKTAAVIAGVFLVVIITLGLLSERYGNTFMTVCSSCVAGTVFAVFIAAAIWFDVKRRAIYRRNEKKLTNSEADGMRRFLQSEFMKFQRRGNLLFSLLCGLSTLTGIILGAIGAIKDPELSFVENVLGMGTAFLLLSAIAACVIWTIFYCVYRSKVKPVEMQLAGTSEN
ncbi:MAG: hypothetical protein K2L67_02995 [Clostridia bacterium]|nr:hypothetical protein [Clostridia bacterium]